MDIDGVDSSSLNAQIMFPVSMSISQGVSEGVIEKAQRESRARVTDELLD